MVHVYVQVYVPWYTCTMVLEYHGPLAGYGPVHSYHMVVLWYVNCTYVVVFEIMLYLFVHVYVLGTYHVVLSWYVLEYHAIMVPWYVSVATR